jgi:hypothetical protein
MLVKSDKSVANQRLDLDVSIIEFYETLLVKEYFFMSIIKQ